MKREKKIYYDTSLHNGTSNREDNCLHSCSGLIVHESGTDYGQRLLAITIPRDACNSCLEQGYKLYNEANMKKFLPSLFTR